MAAVPYMFQIFVDWHGMYRWLLTDGQGRRLRESRYGYEALSAACKDAEAVRDRDYAAAVVRPPTGV